MIDRPVFIIGMPRTGSTVLRDVLANMPEFATTTGLTRKAPTCLPLLRVLNLVVRRDDPVEAGTMWDRFGRPDSHVMRAEDATPAARRYFTRAAETVLAFYRKPRFLAKCPRNALRIDFLLAIFPDARFIHLVRDGRAVCRSILQRRRSAGDLQAWWDARPDGWQAWAKLDPVAGIAHQWDAVVRIADEAGRRLPPGQFAELRYEDFAADPVSSVQRLVQFCETRWSADEIRAATAGVDNRNDKWPAELTAEQIATFNGIAGATLARHGYTV